jgi:hypothetical protein
MRLTMLQSLAVPLSSESLGFPLCPISACCHAQRRFSATVHQPVTAGFILSCSASSSEFLRFLLLPAPFGAMLTCQGFLPFATSPESVHRRLPTNVGDPNSPLCSAPRLSQPYDGLLRILALRAYFISQPLRVRRRQRPEPPSQSSSRFPVPTT